MIFHFPYVYIQSLETTSLSDSEQSDKRNLYQK